MVELTEEDNTKYELVSMNNGKYTKFEIDDYHKF